MKHTEASLHHLSGPGWQISAELELTANLDVDRTVGMWLTAILNPLHLRTKREARYRFRPVAIDACFFSGSRVRSASITYGNS